MGAKKISFLASIFMLLVFVLSACGIGIASYDTYSNSQLGLSFNKPRDWQVFVLENTIFIKPSYNSLTGVFLCPILRAHPKMTALSFIRFVYDESTKIYKDIKILDKKVDKANSVAEVIASFTDPQTGKHVKGFYMISISGGRGLFCGYESPVNSFDAKYTALRGILKNLKISPFQFYNATGKGQFYSNQPPSSQAQAGPTININSLQIRPSTDNSMFIAVPPDWKVGGGNYVLVATSPDEKLGVFITNDHQPGQGLNDPRHYLLNQLMPFFKCTQTVIEKSEPNYDHIKMLQAEGLNSNATNFHGETTTAEGVRSKFVIMVSGTSPVPGSGWVTTVGVMGVPGLFERNFNVLLAIALSINPNQSVIMGRLKENLNRLAQASRTISETGDIVIQALRQGSANTNRAIDKYNYYLSGEEARYSPLENKIYVVDSNLADYASNPNYPQEMLTTVPDNKWNALPHERTY